MKKEFETILVSEIRKAEKVANKLTGYDNCKVTAYSAKVDKDFPDFIDVTCEICRDYEEVLNDVVVKINVFMPDRRMSKAYGYNL